MASLAFLALAPPLSGQTLTYPAPNTTLAALVSATPVYIKNGATLKLQSPGLLQLNAGGRIIMDAGTTLIGQASATGTNSMGIMNMWWVEATARQSRQAPQMEDHAVALDTRRR